jgi:hypothetical protein
MDKNKFLKVVKSLSFVLAGRQQTAAPEKLCCKMIEPSYEIKIPINHTCHQ